MVRLTDRPAMTISVDLGRKATKQSNKQLVYYMLISLCSDQFFVHIQNFLKTQVSGRYAAFTQVCLSSSRKAAFTQL